MASSGTGGWLLHSVLFSVLMHTQASRYLLSLLSLNNSIPLAHGPNNTTRRNNTQTADTASRNTRAPSRSDFAHEQVDV